MKVYLGLLVCFYLCWTIHSSNIQLVKQGYNDIVVAISPRISATEGEQLIPKIKSLFVSGSPVLFNATGRRFFFQSVTILVPRDWPKKPEYEAVSSLSFEEADVRVDLPNPMYGDGPYTLQPGLCGDRGKYIHLTPGYLKFLEGNSTAVFGDPGKTLVHEWSHYRWGVFDEFGIPSHNRYTVAYFDGKRLRPNVCGNKEISGFYWDMIINAPCDFKGYNRPPQHCRFIPALNSEATTSLSSFHFLDKVHTFCNSTNHNYKAPNKHNDLCDGLSAWEVIQMNDDFKKSLPAASSINTKPSFRTVQRSGTAFVLVLDISPSMTDKLSNGITKLQLMKEAVTRWLKYELRLGNAVGIVQFGGFAKIVQPILTITNENERTKVIKNIPNTVVSGTCIGCGLQTALIAFKQYMKAKGGIILLLTDGDENTKPYIETEQDNVVKAGVKVVTIAFTAQADPKIETLAMLTGGKSFFVSGHSAVDSLNSAFFESTTYQTTEESVSVKIHEKLHQTALKYTGNFSVDSSIGNQTVMSLICASTDAISDVKVTGGGLVFTMSNATDLGNSLRITFSLLPVAVYKYEIMLKYQQQILVTVTSQSRNSSIEPIITRCWMELKKLPNGFEPMVIFAEVKQGNSPVLKAKVTAKVDRPKGYSPVYVDLFDNGNGAPDATANDGIYSRYFTSFVSQGRYSVQAQVTDNGNAVIQEIGFTASRSMPAANKDYHLPNLDTAPLKSTGTFERVVLAGSVNVEKFVSSGNKDIIPPSAVRDLQIIQSQTGIRSVILQWTSPGDDLDEGTVSSYDVRISTVFEDLRFNFSKSLYLNTSSIKILPAGKEAIFNFEVPKLDTTYYIALKSADKAGQTSRLSNIAQVNVPSETEVTFTNNTWIYALVGVLIALVVLAVFGVIYKKRKNRETV